MVGCAAPGLDADQAAESRRTCASLRERVANRSFVPLGDDGEFYAELEARLGRADLGPRDGPSLISPATRLVNGCRRLPK